MTFSALLFCILFCVSAFSQEAQKIDEFDSFNCEEYLARMDNFQNVLNNNPSAKGYILIYEGKLAKYDRGKIYYVFPHFGEAKSYKRTMIRRMAFRKFDKARIVFVEAGFREKLTVEFWLVPPGSEQPQPTPTLTKMRYRKGKPQDFCGNDEI